MQLTYILAVRERAKIPTAYMPSRFLFGWTVSALTHRGKTCSTDAMRTSPGHAYAARRGGTPKRPHLGLFAARNIA